MECHWVALRGTAHTPPGCRGFHQYFSIFWIIFRGIHSFDLHNFKIILFSFSYVFIMNWYRYLFLLCQIDGSGITPTALTLAAIHDSSWGILLSSSGSYKLYYQYLFNNSSCASQRWASSCHFERYSSSGLNCMVGIPPLHHTDIIP